MRRQLFGLTLSAQPLKSFDCRRTEAHSGMKKRCFIDYCWHKYRKKESWKCRHAPSAQDFYCWLLFVFHRIQNLPPPPYLHSKFKLEFSRLKILGKESRWKMEIITWQLLCSCEKGSFFFYYLLLNITDLHSLETFLFTYLILLPCFCCLSCQTCWRWLEPLMSTSCSKCPHMQNQAKVRTLLSNSRSTELF